MSALMRLSNRSVLQNIVRQAVVSRSIQTSPKNRETASIAAAPAAQKVKDETNSKNWVSFGFETKSESDDRNSMKASFFFSVTLCLVFGTFVWSYLPDPQLRNWAQREAYLELRRREKAGCDLISADYVDPRKVVLPSDEDLGSKKIII
ncbi:NDUFB11 family protein [Megaselia abdita]